ncbi:hypothetical protein BLA29_006388 [Euroglyphus maynei]|uniref:Uncharacterized protein n=1 Tax=Euroglyphus maynei TaxID=6958 RepID=A0A1Y3BIW4_EURMA|nr:hypothetical protein BLA29_006388 [Euroglyphus maynei]
MSQLGLIKEILKRKYQVEDDELSAKIIKGKQKEMRMIRIMEKNMHRILFENEDGHIDTKQSSLWLRKGNISPQEEGSLCKLQDRNLFYNRMRCPNCRKGTMSVEHLATNCGGMLSFDYKKRHDDVGPNKVRCGRSYGQSYPEQQTGFNDSRFEDKRNSAGRGWSDQQKDNPEHRGHQTKEIRIIGQRAKVNVRQQSNSGSNSIDMGRAGDKAPQEIRRDSGTKR